MTFFLLPHFAIASVAFLFWLQGSYAYDAMSWLCLVSMFCVSNMGNVTTREAFIHDNYEK